ncbi:MAG: hypothetical protein M3Y76_05990, partial [Chloroflexota bacterium]|nr:hypothetical protein [Chloroflexota bacterium]
MLRWSGLLCEISYLSWDEVTIAQLHAMDIVNPYLSLLLQTRVHDGPLGYSEVSELINQVFLSYRILFLLPN